MQSNLLIKRMNQIALVHPAPQIFKVCCLPIYSILLIAQRLWFCPTVEGGMAGLTTIMCHQRM